MIEQMRCILAHPEQGRFMLIVAILALTSAPVRGQTSAGAADSADTYVLIRSDDLGMNHAKNMANREAMALGLPMSVSVMFACPWYQEAVEILRNHPEVSVGVHLTLNAEWRNYRWGPIVGRTAVPSLVDSLGYFHPTRADFLAANPALDEVELELRAQIDRALETGLRIDYLDYHMGAAVSTLGLRSLVERLADEYSVGIPRYFAETDPSNHYFAGTDAKVDSLLAAIDRMETGSTNLLVFHLGLDTPEMAALVDMNSVGLPDMSRHRFAELQALKSVEFRRRLKERGVRLITYRDLIGMRGLESMSRPGEAAYVAPPPKP
jgi:predicted glycoside hydrolase/deacetylase ChbG (UPF0249 family)